MHIYSFFYVYYIFFVFLFIQTSIIPLCVISNSMKKVCFRLFSNCSSSSGDSAHFREASFAVTHNPIELKLPLLRQTL